MLLADVDKFCPLVILFTTQRSNGLGNVALTAGFTWLVWAESIATCVCLFVFANVPLTHYSESLSILIPPAPPDTFGVIWNPSPFCHIKGAILYTFYSRNISPAGSWGGIDIGHTSCSGNRCSCSFSSFFFLSCLSFRFFFYLLFLLQYLLLCPDHVDSLSKLVSSFTLYAFSM